MKNKTVLFLASLLATTTLASCNGNNKSSSSAPVNDGVPTSMIIPEASQNEEEVGEDAYYPDEILLNHRTATIFVDEEYQLSPIEQFRYTGEDLTYKSADESIVTVDATGKLKGIAAGEADILVADKNNPDLNTTVRVTVSPELSFTADSTTISSLVTELGKVDEEKITEFVDYEMYEKRIYKVVKDEQGNPVLDENQEPKLVLQSYDRYDQRMTLSKSDAYLRIWETDAEVRVETGSTDFTNYEWIFYTNPFYDTYTFHTTCDVKNYYVAATQSFMEDERIEPLYNILDNIFVSGREVFTNSLDNRKTSRFTDIITSDYTNVPSKRIGSNGAGNMIFEDTINFDNETADQDDETRYGIPYGTPTPAVQTARYNVKNNVLIASAIHLEETYDIGDDSFVEKYDIDHKFEDFDEQRSQIYVPDRKEYTEVDMLFSV